MKFSLKKILIMVMVSVSLGNIYNAYALTDETLIFEHGHAMQQVQDSKVKVDIVKGKPDQGVQNQLDTRLEKDVSTDISDLGCLVDVKFDKKNLNLEEVIKNDKIFAKDDDFKNIKGYGDWLSRAVILDADHSFSKDLLLGFISQFEGGFVKKYDFCIVVDEESIPKEVKYEEVKDNVFSEIIFNESALKGLDEIKIVFKEFGDDERKDAKVLEKSSKLDESGCFGFSLDKSEIEFGKKYRIYVLKNDGGDACSEGSEEAEIDGLDKKDKIVGRYLINIPKDEKFSDELFSRIDVPRTFGDKSVARG